MSRFREERERLNIQQADLAEKIDVTRRTISRWENDDAPIPSDKLALCAGLGFNVNYVITGDIIHSSIDRPTLSDRERLELAVEAVVEGLEEARRKLPADKLAELILVAYDLMADPVQTKDNVIQLVRKVA